MAENLGTFFFLKEIHVQMVKDFSMHDMVLKTWQIKMFP